MTRQRVAFVPVVLLAMAPALAQESACPVDRAMQALLDGRAAAAADLFEQATRCASAEADVYYDRACAEALAGRRDAAFESLRTAIEQGYVDIDGITSDGDLAGLHDDPRWAELLAAAAAAQRQFEATWGGKAFETPFREDLPVDEKLAGLAVVWSEARASFAYFDQVPDLDWDAAYLEWQPRVRATRSTAEYYRELRALVAKLEDGHTGVTPPKEQWEEFFSRPLLATERIEGRVMVVTVDDDALAARGVTPGLELIAIDGEPVESYADRNVRPYQSASTPQDLEIRVYRQALLQGPAGSTVRLRLRDAAGGEREVEVERLARDRRLELAPDPPVFGAAPLGDGLLRIDLRSFNTEEVVTHWIEHWTEIAAARGLVIDLRENGGGNGGNGFRILATLVDRPFATAAWRTRELRPSYRAWGRAESWYRAPAEDWPNDSERHFAGPVAVLIGPRTYSAAEDFSMAFDAAGRGALVGEASGGSTGQPLQVGLPGGGRARFCSKRDTYPDGREFVGVGIRPQVEAPRTVADLHAGSDAALEAAVAWVLEHLERASLEP